MALEAEVTLSAEGDLNICGRASGGRSVRTAAAGFLHLAVLGGAGMCRIYLFIAESASIKKTPSTHQINK